MKRAAKWLGMLASGISALLILTAGAGSAAAADDPVSLACSQKDPAKGRRCVASTIQGFADNRGGQSAVTVTLTRDGDCSTLTVTFDRPIAIDQPVRLAAEGIAPQAFYTGTELAQLARALDDGAPLAAGPPEFTRFLEEVARGQYDDQEPAREMLNRFAAIKEPRGAILTCGPTARLLAALHSGQPVRLEFQVAPRAITRVYHWPELERRIVDLPLGALAASLDRSP